MVHLPLDHGKVLVVDDNDDDERVSQRHGRSSAVLPHPCMVHLPLDHGKVLVVDGNDDDERGSHLPMDHGKVLVVDDNDDDEMSQPAPWWEQRCSASSLYGTSTYGSWQGTCSR